MLAAWSLRGVAPLLGAVVLLSCNDSPTETSQDVPAALDIVSGDAQEGTVGTELPDPLVVRVEDAKGKPVNGQLVNFRVTSGGGSVFAGSGLTNALGIVQERWTLGTSTAADQRVEARAVDPNTGAAIVFATFTATPLPGAAHALTKISGDGQQGTVGQSLLQPIVVRLTDQFVNPIVGASVAWEIVEGGGNLAASSTVTDGAGHATVGWTLGNRPGLNRAAAIFPGLASVTFSAQASLGAPSALTIVSGNAQTGVVGTSLSQPLVARLTDAVGNPIPDATVNFTVTSGGGSVTPSSRTDSDGHARATWTLGGALGTQGVSAAIGNISANFTATATVGSPATIVKVSGDGQSGTIGQPLAQPLVVRVEDQFGNDVPGVEVSWTVLTGGGSPSPPNGSTDANGLASTQWTLGTVGGTHSIRAQVSGDITATFTANGLVPSGSALVIESGDGQSGRVAEPLQLPLRVRLVDGGGSPISGVAITWTPSSGSASPTSSTTDASGFASTVWTLGTTSGSATLAASATGASPATFTANVRPGLVCTLNVVGGTGQSAVINTPLPNPLRLEVRDRFGNLTGPLSINPIDGFGISSGFLSGPLAADANGVSQNVVWTLGSTVGNQFKTYSWFAQDFLCGSGIIQRSAITATGLAP